MQNLNDSKLNAGAVQNEKNVYKFLSYILKLNISSTDIFVQNIVEFFLLQCYVIRSLNKNSICFDVE